VRSRWGPVVGGLLVGAVLGVVVYYGSKLSGLVLFALVGAVVGIVLAILANGYRRTTRLTNVVVTIPQLSELHFVVDNESRQTAWTLYVEAVTRVSTQALGSEGGSIREALTSLYGLFTVVRTTLRQSRPSHDTGEGPTVELLAVAMLNNEIRPFLSRWHPELERWERQSPPGREHDWPGAAQCRADLAAMQAGLVAYVLGFAKLAGLKAETAEAILQGRLEPVRVPRQDTPAAT
jgi:hypothetical protein